jgi:cellulose synthase/poly-beta-1,6-N-acetylglucosamine synthase-like glycosyltransferase
VSLVVIIFWIALFIVFYSYIGYGILLYLLIKLKRKTINPAFALDESTLPDVTLLVALYNEEDIVERKIRNTLALNYPQQKLQLVFVTDGSTDNTNQIIEKYPEIRLLHKPGRSGKVAAINRAMESVNTPISVFCDANTFLNENSLMELVKHFQNPKVGAVAGEKKVVQELAEQSGDAMFAAGAGEGLYWKYESFLKKLDSEFYTVVGAAGELFAIRTALFFPVEKDVLLDDFIISMQICADGYRVVYEPGAYAMEAPSFDIREEQKRKIRISAGGIQSVIMLTPLLNIFRYGKLSFQYISHRVLRWVVCPFLLPLVYILNAIICYKQPDQTLYLILLIVQTVFYVAAFAGWWFAQKNIKIKALYVPYYFVFMNLSMLLGIKRFYSKTQTVLWDKAKRQATA